MVHPPDRIFPSNFMKTPRWMVKQPILLSGVVCGYDIKWQYLVCILKDSMHVLCVIINHVIKLDKQLWQDKRTEGSAVFSPRISCHAFSSLILRQTTKRRYSSGPGAAKSNTCLMDWVCLLRLSLLQLTNWIFFTHLTCCKTKAQQTVQIIIYNLPLVNFLCDYSISTKTIIHNVFFAWVKRLGNKRQNQEMHSMNYSIHMLLNWFIKSLFSPIVYVCFSTLAL